MAKKKPNNKKAAKEARKAYEKDPKPTNGIKKVASLKPAKGDRLAVFVANQWGALRMKTPLLEATGSDFDYEEIIAEKYGPGKYEIHLCKPIPEKEDKYKHAGGALRSVALCELELEPA